MSCIAVLQYITNCFLYVVQKWYRIKIYLIKIIDLKSYQRENQNFQENGDEGEVWFGEDAMNRMVKFLNKIVEEDLIQNNDPVVDLGTGNG